MMMSEKSRNNSYIFCVQLRNQGGFTLIEMMVTLAVAAIAIAIMVPITLDMMPRYRLKKAARELVTHMYRAKLNAIKEGRYWRITFDTSTNKYTIIDSGTDNNFGGTDDISTDIDLGSYGSDTKYGFGNAPKNWNGVTLTAASQRTMVTFSPRGTCGADSTFLTNKDNTVCYAVTTNAACSIKLRKYNGIDNWIE